MCLTERKMSKRQNFSVNTREIFKKTNSENYTQFNDLLPNLDTENNQQQNPPNPRNDATCDRHYRTQYEAE